MQNCSYRLSAHQLTCQDSSEFIYPARLLQRTYHASFIDISISQSSVATRLRCVGIFNDCFIANFPESVPVKEF